MAFTHPCCCEDHDPVVTVELHGQVVILATGFKVQDFFSPVKLTGLGGFDVMHQWIHEYPKTHYGITAHRVPNSFALVGPNTVTDGVAMTLPS